jgi:hypothetical protein
MECKDKKHVWPTADNVIQCGASCKCGLFKMPDSKFLPATEGSTIEGIIVNKVEQTNA